MFKEKTNILLAEDDLNLGVLLVDFLETEGYVVKLCKDRALALKAFQNQSFDICLLDVMMPNMDGFTLAKEIKLIDKNIPIIFITSIMIPFFVIFYLHRNKNRLNELDIRLKFGFYNGYRLPLFFWYYYFIFILCN